MFNESLHDSSMRGAIKNGKNDCDFKCVTKNMVFFLFENQRPSFHDYDVKQFDMAIRGGP